MIDTMPMPLEYCNPSAVLLCCEASCGVVFPLGQNECPACGSKQAFSLAKLLNPKPQKGI